MILNFYEDVHLIIVVLQAHCHFNDLKILSDLLNIVLLRIFQLELVKTSLYIAAALLFYLIDKILHNLQQRVRFYLFKRQGLVF